MIGSMFAPAFAVIIIDYFIYKKDRASILFNIPGIIAIAAGIFAYYELIAMDLIIGSTVPAMVITVFLYMIIRWVWDSFVILDLAEENL
jgi:purine-cytosine permease-like protein